MEQEKDEETDMSDRISDNRGEQSIPELDISSNNQQKIGGQKERQKRKEEDEKRNKERLTLEKDQSEPNGTEREVLQFETEENAGSIVIREFNGRRANILEIHQKKTTDGPATKRFRFGEIGKWSSKDASWK